MKVLLLGEFSALHKNLKDGLREIGVEVVHASNGDGWKKIESDITWFSSRKGVINWIKTIYSLMLLIPKLRGYDVVQMISPVIFPTQLGINKLFIRYIFNNNSKVFLVGAGASDRNTFIADFFEKNYKYPQLFKTILNGKKELWSQTKNGREYNKWLHDNLNGYIPIMYEYAQGYRDVNYPKLCKTIPIPINISEITYSENIINNKIVIFHGINREDQKGTPLIRDAMLRIKSKYPNDVEIILDGKMSLDKYLEVLKRANIVIDQVYSVSNGVNAVYNLAMGNVVLGGGESESMDEFNIQPSQSPLIAIGASSSDIEEKLLDLIKRKKELPLIGERSRKYAVMVHDYKLIANKYVQEWTSF